MVLRDEAGVMIGRGSNGSVLHDEAGVMLGWGTMVRYFMTKRE